MCLWLRKKIDSEKKKKIKNKNGEGKRECVKCCGKQIKWRWNREERV
jgi:hypothetical protein